MKRKSTWLKALLPPIVLILAFALSAVLVALKPEQEKKAAERIVPTVEVYEVHSLTEPLVIRSEGTVQPRRRTRLTARVSGHIESVSPQFYEGGQFAKGAVLIELDPLPYESALAEAKSRLAIAEAALLQEEEAAAQAGADWESLGNGKPNPLVLREPQLMRARAERQAAKVALAVAQENLEYTRIKAPYDGRVDQKFVDVGQAITAQATVLGEIHASDGVEIEVPLSLDELAYLDLGSQPEATLKAEIAGTVHSWKAYLDRTAASVDPQSRMITGIVRKDAPFMSNNGSVLRPGMFVGVAIQGRQLGQLYSIPRKAVHPGNVVYRVNAENRLESVKLEVIYTSAETAIVDQGVGPGDRLCLTPLLFFVEGMEVEVVEDRTSPAVLATGKPVESETPAS